MKTEHNERMANLEITLLDDGSVELTQGYLEDASLIIHPCHLDFLAKLTGFVRKDEVEHEVRRACAHLHDRLNVLAAVLTAYAKDDERLRSVVDACVGPKKTTGAKGAEPKASTATLGISHNGNGQQPDLAYSSAGHTP